ncbi:MAG TPA: hypothetical protein PK513_00885 [Alphaproteobacteria bacterium]|nr:hypothetical protein [Alphaproteobacteria bacterium]USO05883.1 MAG: hypothetical protein H6859_01385 [Rhodospirillales bacterium]HOO81044.1 hypothetical protein [Alphaproteobacteria bacterium]
MYQSKLNLLIVLFVIVGFFFAIHSLKQDYGQAQAASGLAGKMIVRDAEYSRADKRALRRVMLGGSESLLSLSARDVRVVLSQPELVRRDLPTVIWQYRNKVCVLDVYFTVADGVKKVSEAPVAHYEVRARQKGMSDQDVQEECLENLVRANAEARFVRLDGFYKSN